MENYDEKAVKLVDYYNIHWFKLSIKLIVLSLMYANDTTLNRLIISCQCSAKIASVISPTALYRDYWQYFNLN